MEANPFHCTDCEQVTADTGRGMPLAAVRYCPAHRAESAANMEAARVANLEIATLHRMVGRA